MLLYLTAAVPVGSIVFAVIALSLAPSAIGPILFAVGLASGGAYAYYFGTQIVWLVELTESEFRWRYLLRGGAAPLSDVRSIRYAKTQTSKGGTAETATVEFTSRKPLKFAASQPGLAEFTARVREMAPEVTVELPPGT